PGYTVLNVTFPLESVSCVPRRNVPSSLFDPEPELALALWDTKPEYSPLASQCQMSTAAPEMGTPLALTTVRVRASGPPVRSSVATTAGCGAAVAASGART